VINPFKRQIASESAPSLADVVLQIHKLGDRSLRDSNMAFIRQRAKAIHLGDDTVLCNSLARYKFFVRASDVGFASHLIMDGHWEFPVTEFIARNVARGDIAMDLGANFGYYTLLMADLVGAQGKVHAFEPSPLTMDFLRKSVSINGFDGRVRLRGEAIWDKSGEKLKLRMPMEEPKNARVLPDSAKAGPAGAGMRDVVIETLALDDLDVGNVAFMKVDIEGAEERLWRGMRRFLERSPDVLLLLEFNSARCVDARRTLQDISNKFKLRCLDDQDGVIGLSIDDALAGGNRDWMLVLSNRAVR